MHERYRLGWDTATGVVALLVLALIAVMRAQHAPQPEVSTPSSYDYGRSGYAAVYELLRREGVTVSRFERAHALLSRSTTTLVIAQTSLDLLAGQSGLEKNDVVAVKEWVAAGGRLIVLSPPYGDAGDTLLGIPASRTVDPASPVAAPFARLPLAAGVRAVAGNFSAQFDDAAAPKAIPLLATGRGLVAIEYRLGKGTVVVFTDASVFSNARLPQADNARLALNLLGSGGVAFDETAHGYIRSASLWSALPRSAHVAVYIAGAAILLALIGNLVRFAPPIPLTQADERDSSAYITSMAHLLARARASRTALRDAADGALRSVRRSLGISDRATIRPSLARVEQPELRKQILELDRLRDLENPTEADLIRAGSLCVQLRAAFDR